ncbi:MAG: DUF4386 domain-containing protein [Candidatus Thorarchaeota archaeon]
MESEKRTARIVGILFLIASATPLLSFIGFISIYDANYLTLVAANRVPMMLGVLGMLTMAAAIVGITIAIYPVLKKHNENLALSYIAARVFESIFVVFSVISLVAIFSLSHVYVHATAPVVSYFETSGALLLESFAWAGHLLDIPFVLSALILNYMLYKFELVPKWLSIWGFVGAMVYFGFIFSLIFMGVSVEIFAALLGIQEMALAVWLIVKGFSSGATE